MPVRLFLATIAIGSLAGSLAAAPPAKWWSDDVDKALARAKDNCGQLEKALSSVPAEQRSGLSFLIANMPDTDLASLSAEFLLSNVELAYRVRREVPWGKEIPEELFLNDVLPYANVDEKRDAWRQEFYDLCLPMVKDCKTPTEAVQRLNSELFKKLKLGYSTQRKAPNQSPKESIEQGKASCTGLSIVLSDACRSICIPARLVGTPLWANKSGNHTWVEIWDKGWHFTGACEPDPNGLDRGWFVANASQAKKDSPHAIYAASFKKTDQFFPLVWARNNKSIPGEDVSDRYAKPEPAKAETVRVLVRVLDSAKRRVAVKVTVTPSGDPKTPLEGTSRGESADTNDLLSFNLPPGQEFTVSVGGVSKTIKTEKAGQEVIVEIVTK